MSSDKKVPIAPRRWIGAGVCFVLALFFLGQFLGLLFIERIADRAVRSDDEVRVPISVRLVGFVADKIHENRSLNSDSRLDPDGSNWPSGFRMFFILEMCGLAGVCVALIQWGAALLGERQDWLAQAKGILLGSCLALLLGILFLRLIEL